MNAYRYSHPRSETPAMAMHHVFLIASHGDARGPVMHRGHPLHAMQMVLVSADDASWEHEGAVGPLPALPAPTLMRSARDVATLIPREVTGEILRDTHGKLYERLGDRVRPVRQLFTGARGEVIDLLPAPPTVESKPAKTVNVETTEQPIVDAENSQAEEQIKERSFRELARKLAPDPGFWRIVRYADFMDALSPQLAVAQRLQPAHQLACYLQVYELNASTSWTELERSASRELGVAGKLLPLSYDLCRRFGLSLPRPAFALAAKQSQSLMGTISPGARFITLRVALDPTIETPTATAIPTATATSQTPPATASESLSTALKTAIPEEFGKPWEFRSSRDEAAYDMALASCRGALQRFIDTLFNRVATRDLKKWRSLLMGKTAEQQLWGVTPPQGSFNDSRIYQWLLQTLQLGGYDVPRMRVEWELYWRRRGL